MALTLMRPAPYFGYLITDLLEFDVKKCCEIHLGSYDHILVKHDHTYHLIVQNYNHGDDDSQRIVSAADKFPVYYAADEHILKFWEIGYSEIWKAVEKLGLLAHHRLVSGDTALGNLLENIKRKRALTKDVTSCDYDLFCCNCNLK